MNVSEMISVNFAPTAGMVFMFIFIFYSRNIPRETKRLFRTALICGVIEIYSFNAERACAGYETLVWRRMLWEALDYAAVPAVGFLFLMMAMDLDAERRTKWMGVLLSPLLACWVIAVLSVFFGTAFYYTPDNTFYRGPLYYFSQAVLVFYFILIVWEFVHSHRSTPTFRNVVVGSCIALIFAGVIFEEVFSARAIMRQAAVYCLIFYFIYYQSAEYHRESSEISYSAKHDGLTGLYNRYAYDLIAERLEGTGEAIAFLIFDVDDFKQINDTYGHRVGDEILKRVGEVIRYAFRSTDYVIRFGGDEFVVIMREVRKDQEKVIAGKIAFINYTLQEDTPDLPHACVSAGVTFSSSGFNSSMYMEADAALYETKRHGGKGCTFYEKGMTRPADLRSREGSSGNESQKTAEGTWRR